MTRQSHDAATHGPACICDPTRTKPHFTCPEHGWAAQRSAREEKAETARIVHNLAEAWRAHTSDPAKAKIYEACAEEMLDHFGLADTAAAPRPSAAPHGPQSAGVAAGDGSDGPEPSQEISGARDACVFCRIYDGTEPAQIVRRWHDAIAIVPLNPVTPGHLLVISDQHVPDAADDPVVTATTMYRAAEIAAKPCNIITSAGPEATQTVYHLHVHVVPRRTGDGLALPWTGQAVRSEA